MPGLSPTPVAAVDASWSFAPGPIVLVALMTFFYVRRYRQVAAQAGARDVEPRRLALFVTAMVFVLAALISPIDTLADQVFAMHMVQHVILLDIVPVLVMLSLTKTLLRPVTRRTQALERALGPLAHPAAAVIAYVALMWVWHIPALYDLALEHDMVHVTEHMTVLSIGLLYWWHLLSPIRSRVQIGPFGPVVYMLVTKLFVGFLGIGITFAPNPLYSFYELRGSVWGLSPLDDQAMAGAIMAIEQSIVMGIALTYLFVKALADSEREEERAERYGTA